MSGQETEIQTIKLSDAINARSNEMLQKLLKIMTAMAVLGLTAGQVTAATVGFAETNPIDTNGAATIDLARVSSLAGILRCFSTPPRQWPAPPGMLMPS